MGQKVHPTGFRIGIIYDWQSKWFAEGEDYHKFLQEDIRIRDYLDKSMADASVAKVEIERNANVVTVTIHTAKPGIVIGRGGQKVDELRGKLETLTGKRIRVNIQEIRMPELDATLVARNIADQLERRIAFRRALRQTVARTMGRGAEGCKAMVAGRLGGAEMSRSETTMEGRVPLHTMRADIDYGMAEAHTTFGRIGVKVWIYKGDKLPEAPEVKDILAPESKAAPSAKAKPEAAPAPTAEAKTETPKAEAAPAPSTEVKTEAAPAPTAEAAPSTEAKTEAPKAEAAPAPSAEAKAETETPKAEAAPAPSTEAKTEAAPAPTAEAKTEAPKAEAAPAPSAKPKAKAKAKAKPKAKATSKDADTATAGKAKSKAKKPTAKAATADSAEAKAETPDEAAAPAALPEANAATTDQDDKS